MQGFKTHNSHLFAVTLQPQHMKKTQCPRLSLVEKNLSLSKWSTDSTREKQSSSLLKESPVASWLCERSFPMTPNSWESAVSQKDLIGSWAAPLPQSLVNYTIASAWQDERPAFIKESTERWRERKKGKAAALQQPFASVTAQPVTAQSETHCTPLPLSLSSKSWFAAGVA